MVEGIRHCPQCNNKITHKNQYIANLHTKKGTLCKSCAYINKRHTTLPQVGDKFHKWTVVDNTLRSFEIGKPKKIGVRCECGVEESIIPLYLVDGRSKQCRNCSFDKQSEKAFTGYEDLSGTYYNILHNNAKKRDLVFDLTIDYLYDLFVEQGGKCALSGLDITLNKYYIRELRTKKISQTASVDRIDSNFGYTQGNVQWVHRDINFMKGCLSKEDFVHLCQLVTIKNT